MNKTTIIASAVALALGISACSEQKSLEQLLSSASEHSVNRNFGSAVIELKNAVRIAPKSALARLALGQAYLEQGNYVFAEKELDKAQQLGIDQTSVIPLLAQVKAKLAKSEAVYQLVEISADLNDDDYIIVLTYAGIVALAHNDMDKAQDYIGQAIAISETAAYSQVGKAYLARSQQEIAQSLVDIEILLNEHNNLSEALLLKAHLLFALEDYEQAAGSFAHYLTQHPMDYSVRYFEINSLIKSGLFEQAEVITDKLLAKFENAPLALHYKAQLQYQKGLYKEAKTNAEQAIQLGSTSAVTKLIAGASAYQLKDYEQAYNHLKPVEGFLPNTHPVKKILAVIKLELGYSSEAVASLIALEGLTHADSDFLVASASSLIDIGDFESAQQLIEKAEKLDPDNANLVAKKGFIQLSLNNDEGIQSLERAIELDPTLIKVDLTLGIQYLKADSDNKAQNIANKLIAEHSENVSGYILQGVIDVKNDNINKATNSFKKALAISPDNVTSLYNLAMIYKSEKDFESSSKYFERVIEEDPAHKGALFHYVSLAAESKQLTHSRNFLSRINNENNLTLTIALVQNLRLNQQTDKAIVLLENFSTDKESLNPTYWSILGDSYLSTNEIMKAESAFSAGLKLNEHDYRLNLRRIGTLEVLKKFAEALTLVIKTSDFYPNNERLTILRPYFELKDNNIKEAEKMLAIAREAQLEHYLLDFVAGSVSLGNQDYPRAIEYFSSAYESRKNAEYVLQLARALAFNGQQKSAEQTLEIYIETNATDLKVRLLLAELYEDKDREKKIQQYLAINEASPDNVSILNNLAWNQYQLGQLSSALANLEHAYKISPTSLAVLESYGVVLTANEKYEQAIEVLELAIAKSSKDKEVSASLVKAKIALSQ